MSNLDDLDTTNVEAGTLEITMVGADDRPKRRLWYIMKGDSYLHHEVFRHTPENKRWTPEKFWSYKFLSEDNAKRFADRILGNVEYRIESDFFPDFSK